MLCVKGLGAGREREITGSQRHRSHLRIIILVPAHLPPPNGKSGLVFQFAREKRGREASSGLKIQGRPVWGAHRHSTRSFVASGWWSGGQ